MYLYRLERCHHGESFAIYRMQESMESMESMEFLSSDLEHKWYKWYNRSCGFQTMSCAVNVFLYRVGDEHLLIWEREITAKASEWVTLFGHEDKLVRYGNEYLGKQ